MRFFENKLFNEEKPTFLCQHFLCRWRFFTILMTCKHRRVFLLLLQFIHACGNIFLEFYWLLEALLEGLVLKELKHCIDLTGLTTVFVLKRKTTLNCEIVGSQHV